MEVQPQDAYQQLEQLIRDILKNLDELGKPQELILTDILINELDKIKSSLMPNYKIKDLQKAYSKLQEFQNNLNQYQQGIMFKNSCKINQQSIAQFENTFIKQIFKILNELNTFLFSKDNQHLDQYDHKNIQQNLQYVAQLQKELISQKNLLNNDHQLTHLFLCCKNNFDQQKQLLHTIAAFIIPKNILVVKDDVYYKLFNVIGVDSNAKVQSNQVIQRLNDFFKHFWLNKMYLLRFFDRQHMWRKYIDILPNNYYQIDGFSLKIFTSDFYNLIQISKDFPLSKNKIQISGDRKINSNNYVSEMGSFGTHQGFVIEPFHTFGIFFKPVCKKPQFKCLLKQDQEFILSYKDQTMYEIAYKDESMCNIPSVTMNFRIELKTTRLIFEQQQNQLLTNPVQNLKPQVKVEEFKNNPYAIFENQVTQDTDNPLDQTFDGFQMVYNQQSPNKSQDVLKIKTTQAYFEDCEYIIEIKILKQDENTKNYVLDQTLKLITNDFQHKPSIILKDQFQYSFYIDTKTKQLKMSQVFKNYVSDQKLSSYLILPYKRQFQLQHNTLLIDESGKKYEFKFYSS